jgi:ribosomal protein L22
MEQENKKPMEEKKAEVKEEKKEEAKPVEAPKENKEEAKTTEVKDEKEKKTEAKVNAKSLPVSTKHAMAILNMIRNKNIDDAIPLLELAEKKKIPVPMRGEIPHKKGIMSGRYPVHDLGYIIKVLKSLKSNALVNELELEKYKIFCKANVASRPYKRFGKGRFKRTHVEVKLVPITKTKKKIKGDKK